MNQKQTPCDIFIENFIDNTTGCSDIIYIKDLIEQFGEQFQSNNGCQWARKGSKLDKNYILVRWHANELEMPGGNKVVGVQTKGFKETIENHSIPQEVKTLLKNQPCAVLGVVTTDMEIDHKNGKYDSKKYTANDFQPLTKSVNDAKREHCKRCNATKSRFKASILGYSVDFIKGDEHSNDCFGCYWYDPQLFNKTISSNFKEI
jgi:hypothetical protein